MPRRVAGEKRSCGSERKQLDQGARDALISPDILSQGLDPGDSLFQPRFG